MKFIDLVGKQFGRLTVISRRQGTHKGGIYWLCQCSCGNHRHVIGSNLRSGHTVSCGCFKKEKALVTPVTHGHASGGDPMLFSGAYKSWSKMRERVLNKNAATYGEYGGRGITIDPRWHSFENFYEDMGPRPNGHSIERVDNNGNYEKGNCKWASDKEQANNKRTTFILEWRGVAKPIGLWADEIGVTRGVLYQRVHDRRWPIEKAMTQPLKRQPKRK